MKQQAKPGRTLGISLAIIVSFMIYSLIPIIMMSYVLVIKTRFSDVQIIQGTNMAAVLGGSMGITSVTTLELLLWGIPALIYLFIAILCWIGKPKVMRFIMIGAVLFLFVWYSGLSLFRLRLENQFLEVTNGIAAPSILAPLFRLGFIGAFLVTLYILWYMNRGPARAFFRGYYLPDSEEKMDDLL